MAKPRTLYVSRPLLNGEALRAWARSVGFVSTLPASDMYVTIAFSKRALDWSTVPPKHGGLAVEVGETGHVKRLGKAIVLRFDSPELRARWQAFRDAGASWDFPEFQPHVTISYAEPERWPAPPEQMQPYDGMLRFGAERYAEVKEDWKERVKEEPLRKALILLKARIRGGAAADLFAAPVQVRGHTTREGVFVAPHASTRRKRAPEAPAAKPQADLFAEPRAELIAEHKRLVAVLRSPSHEDDKAEATKQAAELKEMERGPQKTEAAPGPKPTGADDRPDIQWAKFHPLSDADFDALKQHVKAAVPRAKVLRQPSGKGAARIFPAWAPKKGEEVPHFTREEAVALVRVLDSLGLGTHLTVSYRSPDEGWTYTQGITGIGRVETNLRKPVASVEAPKAAAVETPAPVASTQASEPARQQGSKAPRQSAPEDAAKAVERDVARRTAQAAKLRELADRDMGEAEASQNADRQVNTQRRARMAAGAVEKAMHQARIAESMRNLADAIEHGEARHLAGVKTRAAVEMLDHALRQAVYKTDRNLPYHEEQKRKGRAATPDDIRGATLPQLDVREEMTRDIARTLADKGDRDGKAAAAKLARLADGRGDSWVPVPDDLARAVVGALDRAKAGGTGWWLRDALKERDRFAKLGITDDNAFRLALTEYVLYRGGTRSEDPIKRAERDLVNFQGLDFFPTPPALVDRLVEQADIRPGMRVLEPSAGKGDIADALRRAGAEVDVVEIGEPLRRILDAKGHHLAGSDFDAFEAPQPYDRVVMNPPFSMDAEHVQRAHGMLVPGGRLVAIVSRGLAFRQDSRATGFRAWVAGLGGTLTDLPEGSFKSAFRPTGVATTLVVVDRPAAVAEAPKAAEPAPAAPEPQEGDTKTEDGVAYVLRDGRWHRAAPEQPAADERAADKARYTDLLTQRKALREAYQTRGDEMAKVTAEIADLEMRYGGNRPTTAAAFRARFGIPADWDVPETWRGAKNRPRDAYKSGYRLWVSLNADGQPEARVYSSEFNMTGRYWAEVTRKPHPVAEAIATMQAKLAAEQKPAARPAPPPEEQPPPPLPKTFDAATDAAGEAPFTPDALRWQGGDADAALDHLHARRDDFALLPDGRWQRMAAYLAAPDRAAEMARLESALARPDASGHDRERWRRQVKALAGAMVEQAPAAEPASEEPWEGFAKPEEYPLAEAVRAAQWSSMSPERAAAVRQADYLATVNGTYRSLWPLAETPAQRALLAQEMERFKAGYLDHERAALAARSRTASPMVTGPAKFNYVRNEKALKAEHARTVEALDWQKRATAAIKAKLAGSRTVEQVRDDLWSSLRREIGRDIGTVAAIDAGHEGMRGMDRTAFVSAIAGRIERLAARGETALVRQALDFLREAQAKLARPVLTDRHRVWKLAEAGAPEAPAPAEPSGEEVVAEVGGTRIVRDHDAGRVRITFQGKPPEEMRAKLRGAGWKWSPTNTAWQRMNTNASVASAKQIVGAG